MSAAGGGDPFAVLGLPARAGLTDDDVRAAWRRMATATHPDRADGGDPARFAAAAAAYTVLRTRSGRGEALADLAGLPAHRPGRQPPGPGGVAGQSRPGGLLGQQPPSRPSRPAGRARKPVTPAAGRQPGPGQHPPTSLPH